MWRLQLFLVLSSSFLIPYEAKPTTRSPPTLNLTTSATTTAAFTIRRVTNVGRLAAKDLADLLLASVQARGAKMSTFQESTMKSLRSLEHKDTGTVWLHVGMDVIIDQLIGGQTGTSCGSIINKIEKSMDKNSLTLSLRTFLGLCTFNNITCSQQEVVQIIKTTTAQSELSAAMREESVSGSRNIRTATINQSKSDLDSSNDRESVLAFLRARNLKELRAILKTLLKVCGASTKETQNIINNLTEMGPNGMSVVQVNAFSMLTVSLMDSLTSIANGEQTAICAASPESWLVRFLNMGVGKVVLLGLMTALDRTIVPPAPTTTNNLVNMAELNSLNGGDASMNDPKSTKTSVPFKRASSLLDSIVNKAAGSSSGLPVIGSVLPIGGINSATGNNIGQLGGLASVAAPISAIAPIASSATQTLTGNSGITGSSSPLSALPVIGGINSATGNNIGQLGGLASVAAPISAIAPIASSATQTLTGNSGITGSSSPLSALPVIGGINSATGNNILQSGLANVVAPISAIAPIGSSSLTTVTGNSGSSPLSSLSGIGGINSATGNNVAQSGLANVVAPVSVLAPILSNSETIVNGNSGNSGSSSTGSSSGSSNTGSSSGSGSSGGSSTDGSARTVIIGNDNVDDTLADLDVPANVDVFGLNSVVSTVTGTGKGVEIGNKLKQGTKTFIKGDRNKVLTGVSGTVPVNAFVGLLNSVTSTVNNKKGSSGGSTSSSGGTSAGGTSSSGEASTGSPSSSGSSSGTSSSSVGSGGVQIGNKVIQKGSTINGNNNIITKLLNVDLPIVPNIVALSNIVNGGGAGSGGTSIGNSLTTKGDVIKGDGNNVVELVDVEGNVLVTLLALTGITNTGSGNSTGSGSGTQIGNKLIKGPRQVVIGNNNRIVKLVNVDADVLANLNLLNAIRGSGAACIGNSQKSGPDTKIVGNDNSIVKLVDLDLNVLGDIEILNSIINTVGNDCATNEPPTEPPTQPPTEPPTQPPTEPPTQPPTEPPTQPPTEPPTQPPTEPPTQPPTEPPTQPPTEPPTQPPTEPPTPNPNNCYRRYCRKWRTRPSYLCHKNCGGNYIYRP